MVRRTQPEGQISADEIIFKVTWSIVIPRLGTFLPPTRRLQSGGRLSVRLNRILSIACTSPTDADAELYSRGIHGRPPVQGRENHCKGFVISFR